METAQGIKSKEYQTLHKRLMESEGLEARLDEIRKFKKEEENKLSPQIHKGKFNIKEIMHKLTGLADAILINSFYLAKEVVRKTWGIPCFKDNDGQFLPDKFALIGMGKLGGHELHFGSDLDLIFIFERNGHTEGGKIITNQEFYSKITQRIISYLTIHSRFGYAYKVDTELRPSGLAGALVTALDPWISYYHEKAALWEKQALLKARLIYGEDGFLNDYAQLFRRLIFMAPFPETLPDEINHLRVRIEKELAKETSTRWHYKKGYGGLVDIEFAVQFLQLKLGKIFENLVTPNTLDALEALRKREIISIDKIDLFKKAYEFYRIIEIYLEMIFNLRDGYLNPQDECVEELAQKMSFRNKEDFLKTFEDYRQSVRNIYLSILKVKE